MLSFVSGVLPSSSTVKSGGCTFPGADSDHSDLDASVIREVESSRMVEPEKSHENEDENRPTAEKSH